MAYPPSDTSVAAPSTTGARVAPTRAGGRGFAFAGLLNERRRGGWPSRPPAPSAFCEGRRDYCAVYVAAYAVDGSP